LPLEARLGLGLILALAVAYSATLLAIRVAVRFEFYDKPVGYKGHGRPTPYLGGAAVIAGFLLALLAINADSGRTLPLVAGIGVLWAVGTLDDRHTIAPSVRVAVEALLALLLWATGLGWDLGLGGAVDLVLTILWVIAVVNAFNLFDNMDGAASTMALVVSAGVVAMGIVHDDTWLAVAAVALCGACLGFLPHNLASPARIFLGDGGSMPIGFAVAALVMIGSAEAVPAWQALVVGLLLVGVPALDTGLVMISRRRRGISILTGGRDHLTHRAQRRLRTARAVAMGLGAVQALVSALALFAINGGAAAIVLIVVLYFVAAATAIALLEATESERTVATVEPLPAGVGAGGSAPLFARRPRPAQLPAIALVVLFGAAAGASPFFSGFYEQGKWVPIGLFLLIVATAGAIARPPRLSRQAIVALVALGGLALWSLISSAWAPSIEQSTVEGNRTVVLAATLATAMVLVSSDVLARWLIGGLVAGILAVAGYVLVHLLGSHPASLFLAGRLDQPLGYTNAQGTVFVMGFWLCFCVAERRRGLQAGLAVGVATLMACLAVLTQSRGVALAMIASIVVVVALVPGNRVRRIYALFVSAIAFVIAWPTLKAVYDSGLAGPVPAPEAHRAAVAALIAGAAAGIAWGAGVALHERFAAGSEQLRATLARAGAISLAVVLVGAVGASAISASKIADTASDQWRAFVHLSDSKGATDAPNRLVSGAGNRYDYWRVAVDAFRDHPLDGVGAGNYDRPYFQARKTTEDVRQPHSLELQVLSELGLVGGALLALFVGALAVGAWRMRAAAVGSPQTQALMVAALGTVTAWFAHTSVDWVHLMPGLTAIALAMAAVLLRDRSPVEAVAPARVPGRAFSPRPSMVGAAALVGLALVVAAGSLSRQGLADLFRDRASDALAAQPAQAVREANRSLRLDAENPRTYYIKAAALARFNQAAAAQRVLRQALSKEPDDFVTWTLLGDLAVRRGDFRDAKRNYSRASALNPLDASLKALADDPRSALEGTGP
jgi:UDP-GlcNAc:undecaprenyl-phosphate GlcNAc-1-phosphate transferase